MDYPVCVPMTTLPHNGTLIVAQPDPAANPSGPGRIVHGSRLFEARYGRRILQTVAGTVCSGGNASTVRNP